MLGPLWSRHLWRGFCTALLCASSSHRDTHSIVLWNHPGKPLLGWEPICAVSTLKDPQVQGTALPRPQPHPKLQMPESKLLWAPRLTPLLTYFHERPSLPQAHELVPRGTWISSLLHQPPHSPTASLLSISSFTFPRHHPRSTLTPRFLNCLPPMLPASTLPFTAILHIPEGRVSKILLDPIVSPAIPLH